MVGWLFGQVWDFLFYTIPWWVWGILGLVAVLFVWRLLGTKASLALAGVIGLFLVDRRARQQGRALEVQRQKERVQREVERRMKINKEVAAKPISEVRDKLRKYERKKP